MAKETKTPSSDQACRLQARSVVTYQKGRKKRASSEEQKDARSSADCLVPVRSVAATQSAEAAREGDLKTTQNQKASGIEAYSGDSKITEASGKYAASKAASQTETTISEAHSQETSTTAATTLVLSAFAAADVASEAGETKQCAESAVELKQPARSVEGGPN